MKFNTKMHLCCANDELRPVMNHVYFDKNKIVASDAHVLMVADMDDFNISDDEKKILNGKYLHWKAWRKIWNKEILIMEDGIHCKSEFIIIPWAEIDGKYPDWRSVLPRIQDSKGEVDSIGIDGGFLSKLTQCFPRSATSDKAQLHFTSKVHAILVFVDPLDVKSYGIIMPTMLSDGFNPFLNSDNTNYHKQN